MLLLVLADNYLLLYVGWEGVGLASYLLIGFWFYKPSRPRSPAKKAFIVNRVGDVGLSVAIMLMFVDLRLGHVRRRASRGAGRSDATHADVRSACCCCSAPAASRRSSRCSPGCSTRWRARRRSPRSSTRRRW